MRINSLSLLFFAPALFSLCGCATLYNPATERKELIFIDSKTEAAIGKTMISQINQGRPPLKDKGEQERIERLGRRLAQVSDRQDIGYHFFALEDKELNAMALPGGFIYVNSGLIAILNDDELAYVLGHETGHTAARHIAKKIQAGIGYQLLLSIAFASISDNTEPVARDVAQGVDMVYGLIEKGYSRQDEYEADRLGVKYAFKAGFQPQAALTALEKIKKGEGPNWKILGYFRTHPYVEERIAALKAYIAKLKI
ncbi:MAG: M48 family metallopeptidase [Candidatus Omnitrophota bacterium]